MAIINPKPKSLRELIRDRYYRIPPYQRPYDWEIDQVSELWDDVSRNDSGYFLGTVLFIPNPPQEQHPVNFEIVDGQQRLATLLLLLRAAVETLEKTKDKKVASDFQKEYVAQSPAGVDKPTLTLVLNKRDKDKFESLLLGQPFSKRPILTSWKNLDKTIQFFRDKFAQLKKDEGRDGIVNFLNEKVLKLSLIEILLGTDSDVYQFFETLNDRGMDLSIADLVKNRVCAEAVKQNQSVEDSVLTIDRISEGIGPGRLKSFLLHYCWANGDLEEQDPTPRKKLMEWYAGQISKDGDVRKFLSQLEKYALQYYVNFVNPVGCDNRRKREVFTFLDALGATRCYPLLLAGEEHLDEKNFLKLCWAVELLTFRHSTILKRDAKALESFFYGLIRDIRQKRPINEILEGFKKQESIKTDEQFRIAFADFVPANHKQARYVLLKIEEFATGKKQTPLDWSGLTLEHILAEKLDWEGRGEYLERLGNLTLLSLKMNEDAANKPFVEKKRKIYEREKRIKITKDLIELSAFTKDTIVSRQKELAEHAVKIWSSKTFSR